MFFSLKIAKIRQKYSVYHHPNLEDFLYFNILTGYRDGHESRYDIMCLNKLPNLTSLWPSWIFNEAFKCMLVHGHINNM